MSLLSGEEYEWLLSNNSIEQANLGQVIESSPEDELFILVSGQVRVIQKGLPPKSEATLTRLDKSGSIWGRQVFKDSASIVIRASANTTYLKLQKTQVDQLLAQNSKIAEILNQESNAIFWFSKLMHSQRFDSVDYELIKPLLLSADSKQFSARETFPESKTSNGIFIVLEGELESSKDGGSRKLKPGEWFSRGNIFPSQNSKEEEVTATTSGELLRIKESTYKEVRRVQPELSSKLDGIFLSTPGSQNLNDSSNNLLTHVDLESQSGKVEKEPEVLEEGTAQKLRRSLKKYPIVYQHSELECGITCLQMVSLFFGKSVSMSQLRDMSDIGRSGTSMLDLAETAEQLGFFSRGVKTTYSGLMNLKPPLICYWKQNHFVVLYEINKNHAIVGDPATGLEKISAEVFKRDFSEHALEIIPSTEFGKNIEERPIVNTFTPIIKPHKNLVRDVVLASIIYQLLMLVTPIFTQVVLDQVIVHQDMHMLTILLIGMVLISVLQAAMGFIRQFLVAYLALKADQSLFSELLKRLFRLPFPFFDKHSTGDILTRFGESTNVVQFFAGQGAVAVLDLFMAIIFLSIIFFYNTTFGIAATVYVLALVGLVACCIPYLKKLSQRAYDKQIAAESFLVEAIRGIERIKSAAAEKRTRWKWELLFTDKLNVRFQELTANATVSTLVHFAQICGQVAFLWIGAHMVVENKLTIGQLIAVNMLIGMIANPFIRIAELSYAFQNVSVALQRLAEILLEPPEESNPESKVQIKEATGNIEFEKVTYRYSGHESANALSNVSFNSNKGEMIGIVGKTGSGKTTLLRLLQGLYLPSEGRILVDGKDLSKISLSSYRQNIGVVSQHDYYFRGTIRENIAFYKPEATLEEIVSACTVSGADDFISKLPSGYESMLTEGASNFSGGQRQCMAIARAIIHNPSILIFDEATSGMDSDTEQTIQQCMESMRQKCTMFVVAHRLSTVKNADKILVIDKGMIVESGTHSELIDEKGLYYYLCKQQSLS